MKKNVKIIITKFIFRIIMIMPILWMRIRMILQLLTSLEVLSQDDVYWKHWLISQGFFVGSWVRLLSDYNCLVHYQNHNENTNLVDEVKDGLDEPRGSLTRWWKLNILRTGNNGDVHLKSQGFFMGPWVRLLPDEEDERDERRGKGTKSWHNIFLKACGAGGYI